MKILKILPILLIQLLFAQCIQSQTLNSTQINYYIQGLKGLYVGIYSGLHEKVPATVKQDCLDFDFANRTTHIINTFLKHGFALFRLIEDGSIIVSEMTECQFDRVGFELYELCDIKQQCQIKDAKNRINKLSFQMVGHVTSILGIIQDGVYPPNDIDEFYSKNLEIGKTLASVFLELFELRKFP
ncbi:UNKNOWN [Stylonychia lemnae]|uniref:Uncharacterized protein n=1 Tax=Stylonychia lemnae TaxID=5949 RepID=A0A078B6J3_STYLE|nr:UNKNOWN [Stylonychia lemnae]|eukprot:CDW89183.1 UNKNOWN [Stylonychia lemnae]